MNLPTDTEIKELHKKYAPTKKVFAMVYVHSQIIWRICKELIDRNHLDIDEELTKVGAMLHDIGVHKLFDEQNNELPNYITHGVRGYEILKAEGFEEVICRFAAHHTGVGISKKQIIERDLPIPPKDYFAENPEEEIVMYADKFHSKEDPLVFNSVDWYINHVARFGQGSVDTFKDMVSRYGEPNIENLAKEFGQKVRA